MKATASFECDPAEPLGLLFREVETPDAFAGSRCHRFEYNSRGDRVPGRCLLPSEGTGPFPLILLQHGVGGSVESPYMEAAAPWVRGGAAVASIDFPLHGRRASAKLSQRLIRSLDFEQGRGGPGSPDSQLLLIEFARQSVMDLRRAMDALGGLEAIDERRLAYTGFSLGGILGAICCAVDPRPRAAALALAGGGFGPEEIDPCSHIAKLAPRPLLLVGAKGDQRVSRRATEALFEAAAQPKRLEWFDGDHSHLPGVALKAMWIFLRDQLGLSA